MAIDKKDILGFLSAEGFSPSGYEESILNKFAAFLDAPAPVEAPAEVSEEAAPKKAKAKAE